VFADGPAVRARGIIPHPTEELDLEVEVQRVSDETSKKFVLPPSHEQVFNYALVALKQFRNDVRRRFDILRRRNALVNFERRMTRRTVPGHQRPPSHLKMAAEISPTMIPMDSVPAFGRTG